ncbi:AIPR family protein [Ethanoligenens harbinense]|uniref:Abortive phage infection n=1 Tax=Ethanoligenens harbinense (strain DSM 18485 / JCM 12961 / CGMCC 1.5033 / YUAN-3) TaxID=663278 RepID=E6U3S2_ETHHY|nr:AIPR family protein [Ethanoligenens harbinense]ADU26489.1 Abortive phage infection [Ethanoligenens harbinense YUAN-3]AVQ95616.1 abortive phage infection protein [Ethanoligenens harbinense YUAN-3]AYF38280.1 abortive phage infection protein [Ethanoligenens harbinense]AYF41026.1 abortive phage infection protein [Ethanoligenens harbinense]QCN91856.1 abortive phage infection protein [Ethanoligenens harbinense]
MANVKFKVEALRTLASPYRKGDKDENTFETIYYLLVDMKDLPSELPLDVNPREPKMTTSVARSLLNAVIEPETDFYINNRGIVIAAKSLSFNSTDSEVSVDLGNQDDENDKFQYGILDGGHTYTAIMEKRNKITNDIRKYVRVEVITNVQNITRLSDARNTSVQVSDMALFNLDNNFEDVKDAVSGQVYADWIAYKDNENKAIHVSELLRLMYAFDIDRFPDDNAAPVQSYSGKAQVFKRYKQAFETPFYKSLTKQIPVLVELYDLIERELPEKYKEYKKSQGVSNPRFGSVRGIESLENETKTEFFSKSVKYSVSTGYIYPIFGAFRSLLRFDKKAGTLSWLFNPVDIWNEVGISIVQNTFETYTNPQLAGKDKQLWLSNYRIVETQSLRKLLSRK